MRAGKLDRRITIQRATITLSDAGADIATWADLAYRIPAGIEPSEGVELLERDRQVVGRLGVVWRIRWSSALAGITQKDRIIYPSAIQNEQEPATYTIFDVADVSEEGRHRGIFLRTFRRGDAST